MDDDNPDENVNPNYGKGDLSKIDEETEEEQPHRIEPHRLLESPSKPGMTNLKKESIIDNLQDSINNYMDKRSGSVVDGHSNRQS